MIQILEGTSPNVVSTKAIGKIDQEDQDRLVSFLNEKLNNRDSINWYFEMEKFVGWEPGVEVNDLKESLPKAGYFKKISIVGARDWQDRLKTITEPFSSEVRFFEAYEKQEAIRWVEK